MRYAINLALGGISCVGATYVAGNHGGIIMIFGILVGFTMALVAMRGVLQ